MLQSISIQQSAAQNASELGDYQVRPNRHQIATEKMVALTISEMADYMRLSPGQSVREITEHRLDQIGLNIEALKNRSLSLELQPIIDNKTGYISGLYLRNKAVFFTHIHEVENYLMINGLNKKAAKPVVKFMSIPHLFPIVTTYKTQFYINNFSAQCRFKFGVIGYRNREGVENETDCL